MAHFYAEIKGNRGEASRMGSKESGIRGHIRGWNVGVEVSCYHDERTGKDVCYVYLTGGSNGSSSPKFLGAFTKDDLKDEKLENLALLPEEEREN